LVDVTVARECERIIGGVLRQRNPATVDTQFTAIKSLLIFFAIHAPKALASNDAAPIDTNS
jgi:hypothetical protein